MTTTEPAPWLRGVLEPCLLGLLADGEAYGYELSTRLEEAGIGTVPGGSLYPALLRLEKRGLLTPQWRAGDGGPGRKYYALTAEGRRSLAHQRVAWAEFASAVTAVLTGDRRAVTPGGVDGEVAR
ncbi:MAG: PadR family transcriptional regulator [Actinomycetota bacterium]